ncbi:MAG: lamin tail domain-containing protein [Phycisphaerae bacterium]|nr:lamin tail domain-containing protein [Phycisphaerae bacterium]
MHQTVWTWTCIILVGLTLGRGSSLRAQSEQTVVISEIMARNHGELLDEDGDASDWIELYNPTQGTVDLGGWSLTDDPDNAGLWTFPPDITLASGEYLVVFASGKDRVNPGGPLHTNFKLSGTGEYLALMAPDGVTPATCFDPTFGVQLEGVSFGTAHHADTLVTSGAHITYRIPGPGPLTPDWTDVNFNDATWRQGTYPLSFRLSDPVAQDIGSVRTPGSVTLNQDGVYMVNGAGADIWGQADAFHYVYQSLRGDGELTARVLYVTGTHDWAKAGIMIRETLDAGAKHAMGVVSPGHGTSFQGRTETGQASFQVTPGNPMGAPVWLRLVRSGDTFTAYDSEDGETWTRLGAQTIDMRDTVFMGLCVCSHDAGQLCPALFDRVSWDMASNGDLTESMLGHAAMVQTRCAFTLEQGQKDVWDQITLSLQYQDGFALYLNGHPVTQVNAPDDLSGLSTALTSHDPQPGAVIDLTPFKDLLIPGRNVLALIGLNDHADDPDFFMAPRLVGASSKPVPQYFAKPTPGAANVPGSLGQVPPIHFSHTRGFWNAPFELTLSTDSPDAVIRMTLDGSIPTQTHGTVYTAPLWIDHTTTLRTVACQSGFMDSDAVTHTYLFLADIVTQSPRGERPGPDWPNGSVNGQMINYGMDPEVVQDPRYQDTLFGGLVTIPSISLVTDLTHLFNSTTGIYTHAGNDGRDWERPVSVELIRADDTPGFQVNAGLRIRGGFSRSGSNPKHAFRLLFRSEYGPATLKYPLFEDEGTDEFDKVDLRTSQNYSWSFQNSNQNTMVREVFSRDLQGETGQPYTRSRYYHLYLNGQYWGLYMTQERSEASFAAAYLGGQREDYDCIKTDSQSHVLLATDGNMDRFRQLYDLTMQGLGNNVLYMQAQGLNPDGSPNPAYPRLLDPLNLADFMIIEYYTGGRDGPGSRFVGHPNNTFGIINRVNPDGFKWFHHDNEHTLGAGSSEENMVVPFTTAGSQWQYFNPQWQHEELMRVNSDYRLLFADQVVRYFFNQGLLTAENSRARVLNRAQQIDLAMIAESARWGDAKKNDNQRPFTRDDDWLPEIDRLLYNSGTRYLTRRVEVVMAQLRDVGWLPTVDPPMVTPHGGPITASQKIVMDAPVGQIYYTTDGSDPRLPIGQSRPGALTTLVREQAEKRYQIPTGQPLEPPRGTILAEYWDGINGTDLGSLTGHPAFPNQPTRTAQLTQFEIPVDHADQYGTRVTGYLYPPTSTTYTFWIASDDASQLWLSTDESPGHKTLIARVDGWTGSRQWDQYASQKSTPIALKAGQKYYVEALQKEGGGGDNLSVAWQYSGHARAVIAGPYLAPASSQWTQWTSLTLDDSTWTQAAGILGYDAGSGDFEALIQEDVRDRMLGVNTSCQMRIPFDLAHTDFTQLTLSLRYDDGAVVYLNGVECLRCNFGSSQAPQWSAAAAADRDTHLAVTPEVYDLSDFRSVLRTGANILAIQGLNYAITDAEFLMGVSLTGLPQGQGDVAPTAQTYQDPIVLPHSVPLKARVFHGTWSAVTQTTFSVGPVARSLRVTELMYHPLDNQTPSQADAEYIEFKNTDSDTINLALVRLSGGVRFTFPSWELAAGDSVLVVKDRQVFESVYGPGLPIAGTFEGTLSNQGERLTLQDATGAVFIDFEYQDQWYPLTDGSGFSLTCLPGIASDPKALSDLAAWQPSQTQGGSPGYAE